jgi:hypothetical protein
MLILVHTSSGRSFSARRGNHAKQHYTLRVFVERGRLRADGADQEVSPLLRREALACFREHGQHVRLRHQDRPQRGDAERTAVLLLRDQGVVLERDQKPSVSMPSRE